jgi:tetratricopeptide (TPR) repeat protein
MKPTTIKWRWWFLIVVGAPLAAALIWNDAPAWIALGVVSGGLTVLAGWPALYQRLCIRRVARSLDRENIAEARRWLQRLLPYDRPDDVAYVKLIEAGILSVEEKFGNARLVLTGIERVAPRMDLQKHNALAWCEAHDGAAEAAVPRAEANLERARLQYPALIPYCLGTLGAARVLAGKSGAAIEPLQQALTAGKPPRAQSIRAYYLGEAYRAGGRTDEALAAYERARRESPQSRWAQKAADRIQELAKASPYR